MMDNLYTFWALKLAGMLGLLAAFLYGQFTLCALDMGWKIPAGQALGVTGVFLTLRHYILLKKVNPRLSKPDTLVTQGGLFRHVRHPMYLGDLLTSAGLTLASGLSVPFVLLGLTWIARVLQSKVEDKRLSASFPDEFRAWKSRTRLLLPYLF